MIKTKFIKVLLSLFFIVNIPINVEVVKVIMPINPVVVIVIVVIDAISR